ncbi:lipopolysaccharide biosynthesis protein [Mycetocola zhadangensis]|uniref:Lipopolysaccharide biosynthesis protein n=1 Tax=Mycetocola zhadangensis TaxID=1164595 RepID=A0A3L7IX38_9MICO|nr:lipopolysaccharide biosynthesis protein [Mycetocola zhadangensis]RLQ82730.1 lipopolysaccharide biosynthesis protein [Mycetocola zhadangensis]GGE98693.1 lipopolysaccharide biosynthesis protein [Mycetocola zhadangensis]
MRPPRVPTPHSTRADPAASAEASASLENLGHQASRGVLVTMGGTWSKALLQTVSTIVLARLLDPADFGLIAMIMAIVGIADLVRDFGMTGAIIQAKRLNDRTWSSVLWLSAAVGVLGTVLIALCAPLIAAIYNEQQLVLLSIAVAPTLLINGLAMPLQAKVQRDLKFGVLARIDVLSMALGVGLSIAAALAGWGVWSLVVFTGAASVYRLIALWSAARPHWGRPHVDREVIPLLTTGGSIFGVQLLNYLARNVDNVVIGRQLGADVLGQYSRAYALFMLPLQQLNGPLGRVALPVLSRLQDDGPRYRRYIRAALMVIAYLTLPAFAIAAALAQPLVLLLLGPQWDETAAIFALLTIAGVAQAIGNVQGWIYISLGRAHRQLVYYLVSRPIIIGSFFVGLWWNGVNGLALAYGTASLAVLVPGFAWAIRGTFVTGRDVVLPVLRPAALVPFAFAAALATTLLALPPVLHVLAGGLAGLVPLGLAMAIPAYRRDLAQIVDFVKQTRKPSAPEGQAATVDATDTTHTDPNPPARPMERGTP